MSGAVVRRLRFLAKGVIGKIFGNKKLGCKKYLAIKKCFLEMKTYLEFKTHLEFRCKRKAMAALPTRDNTYVLSSQRKTAPCARTARRKDDVFGSVSWLAGHNPSPPSRAFLLEAQWHF